MKFVIITEMLLSVYFVERNPLLSLWFVFHWSLWFLFHHGNVTVFQETVDTYPDRQRITPRYFQFIWKPLYPISDKQIPREIYYTDLFVCAVFVCYTLALVLFWNHEILPVIAKHCLGLYIFSLIVSRLGVIYKAHLAKYKCLTCKNLRYLFDLNDESTPSVIGACKIIGVSRKSKKYVVSVIANDQLFERVIIEKNAYRGENTRYMLYEFHGVYYAE